MDTEVFPFTIYPLMRDNYGDRLLGYEIILKISEYEITGLSKLIYVIRDRLHKKGLVPVMAYPSLPNDDKVLIFFVVDRGENSIEDTDRTVFSLKKFVREIVSIEKSGRFKNIVYAKKFAPLTFLGGRAILFGPASLKGIIIDAREELGPNVASMLLSILGRKLGESIFDYYQSLGEFEKISETIEFLRMLHTVAGWGTIEAYSLYKDRIIIRTRNLWECEILEKNGLREHPSYYMGALTGFFSKVFNREVYVNLIMRSREEENIYCVFSIKR